MEMLHEVMDRTISERRQRIDAAKEANDTTKWWQLINSAVEEAFTKHMGPEGPRSQELQRQRGSDHQNCQGRKEAPTTAAT